MLKYKSSFPFLIISILIVLVDILIGHFFAPTGITNLPIALIVITILILFYTKFNINSQCLIIALLFLFADIGLKLYAGGTHDSEGQDFYNLFYFIGAIPSFGLIIFRVLKNTEINKVKKVFIILAFLIFLYFQNDLLGDLGYGKSYPM
jgi:uncharacterized membrane protein YGL010W